MTKIQEIVKGYEHKGKYDFPDRADFESIRQNLGPLDYMSLNLTSPEISDATIRTTLDEYDVDLNQSFVVFHATNKTNDRFTQLYYATNTVGVYARVAVDTNIVTEGISRKLLSQTFGNADKTGISIDLEAIGYVAQTIFLAAT